jgi:ankyrin repeat protein
MKRHVDAIRPAPEPAPEPDRPPRDREIRSFLRLVGTGRLEEVRRAVAASPELVKAVGPHPFWGGRAQALHVAIESGRREMFDALIDAGADVDGTNEQYDRWSPLMVAIHRDRRDMRDALLRRGARVGLVEALLLRDDKRVETILREGVSGLPAHAPNDGSLLAFARTRKAIDRLLDLGVPLDRRDRWGDTPIDALSRLGARGRLLVRHLVARGAAAPPEVHGRLGDRRALAAVDKADPGAVRSDAVLLAAVEFGHHELVKWLIARGANVHARGTAPARPTALHIAAWNGDLKIVELLIEAGASPTVRDEQHHGTAREWAEVALKVQSNPACQAVVEYLAGTERGAPPDSPSATRSNRP